MLTNNYKIVTLGYEDAIKKLSEQQNISLEEAKGMVSQMSFLDYHSLLEANITVTPPSGQTISPTTQPTQTSTSTSQNGQPTMGWAGKGTPIQQGMTVGVKNQQGMPVPGQVTQVDAGANGVKVKDPTTGQEQWQNQDELQPFMASSQSNGNTGSVQTAPTAQSPVQEEENELRRILELAGIKENCSAGATGAGAIAIAPAAMGGVKKRQSTEEEIDKHVTPKTIVGDTKPNQATGALSSNLAAKNKHTASRSNNGHKK